MYSRIAPYPKGKLSKLMELKLGGDDRRLNGGINVFDLPFGLENNQSSDMVNLIYRDGGLTKRDGLCEFVNLPSGRPAMTCQYDNHSTVYFYDGLNIYAMAVETGEFTLITTVSVEGAEGNFALFGSDVYFTDGTVFGKCTASGIQSPTPYVPTVIVGRSPDGIKKKGTANESINGMTDRFYIQFDCDGESNQFFLPEGCEYISAVTQEEVYFTYNKKTNILQSGNPLPLGYVVTVLVRCVGANRIVGDDLGLYKCKMIAAYAGDGRIYLCGNGTNILYPSDVGRPDYFPTDLAARVGNFDEITAVGRQYDTLVLFKSHETMYAQVGKETVIRCLNPVIGCDMPGSVQTVGNRLVFANSEGGIYIVVSTTRQSERNVQPISRNIDPKLFKHTVEAKRKATSVCFEGRYWLCIEDKVYVWDYTTRPYIVSQGTDNAARRLGWYIFEGINAGTWFIFYNRLYLTERQSPRVSYMVREFTDYGKPICAHWKSPVLDFGIPHVYKRIENVWFLCRGDRDCYGKVRYLYDMYDGAKTSEEQKDIELDSFNWHDFTWPTFMWGVAGLFKTIPRRPARRRVVQFAVEVSSDRPSELSIVDVVTSYREEYRLR